MTHTSFLHALRAFVRRRPFQPYLLQLTTGETVLIAHPEAVRAYGEVVMLTEPNDRTRLFDAWSVCQLLEAQADSEGGGNEPPQQEGQPS